MNPFPEARIVSQAARPFAADRFLWHYAGGKMRWDPAYPMLARLLRAGDARGACISDLGCGAGVFASYLRASGIRSPIAGVDLDAEKIRFAREHVAAAWPSMEFSEGDLFDWRPRPGNLVALDVLHYFSTERREALLRRLAGAIEPGGVLYLRNGVRDAGWRHWITTIEEAMVRSTRWIRGGEWNFPSSGEIETILREEGLAVSAVPMWGKTPFSSMLFVAARVPVNPPTDRSC